MRYPKENRGIPIRDMTLTQARAEFDFWDAKVDSAPSPSLAARAYEFRREAAKRITLLEKSERKQ